MAMPVSGVATGSDRPARPTATGAGHALARIGRAIRSNRKATAGTVLLAIFILVALFPGRDRARQPDARTPTPRSWACPTAHLLGTTALRPGHVGPAGLGHPERA